MDIVKESEQFIQEFFKKHIPEKLAYHSINHTNFVVEITEKIAIAEGLDERNKNIVTVAAWFHDTGYSVSYCNHEKESCKIARRFLKSKNTDDDFIKEVEKCIMVTKPGAIQVTLTEKIISDADFAHTAQEKFIDISILYQKEITNYRGEKMSELDYWQSTLEFLNKVKFNTKYAQKNMEEIKNKNIIKIVKHIETLKAQK